jgi:peptidoglycan lytic transglycosylase
VLSREEADVAQPVVTRGATRREIRRAQARRKTVARRRVTLLVALALVALGVFLALPLFKKAVTELTLPLNHADIIRQQAADKHLQPALIAAVIYAETKFDSRTSPAGAQGLMQIMPETAKFLAKRSGAKTFQVSDLSTPQVNIAYGSYLLRYLLDHYHGNLVFALAAYNGGETNADRWVAEARKSGHKLTIARIPFPETRAYVQKVLRAEGDYRHKYASQLGYQ